MEVGTLVRFTTGHNFLNRHRVLLAPTTPLSKLCRFCGEEEETGDHIINNCPRFISKRAALNQTFTTKPEDWSICKLTKLLQLPDVQNLEEDTI